MDTFKQVKSRRGRAKSKVTRLIHDIEKLMVNLDNVTEVGIKSDELNQALGDFMQQQDEFHRLLTTEAEIAASQEYCGRVVDKVSCIREDIVRWIAQVKSRAKRQSRMTRFDDIEPRDSASNTGRYSVRSGAASNLSMTSSVSSARLKAAAEISALEAEAKTLAERQALEQEEFKLLQRRNKLELREKLAKAEAQEKTYAEAEGFASTPIVGNTVNAKVQQPKQQSPISMRGLELESDSRHALGDVLTQMLDDSRLQQQSLMETLQLPKTEMATFDGDPVRYWAFIRTFDTIVDKDTISSEAKLARLLQYCTGPARGLIDCCAVMGPDKGYARARELLKSRFGNAYRVSEAWIERVTSRPDVSGSKALQEYADELRNCRETLFSMDKLAQLNNSRSLLQIAEKLPAELRRGWAKKAYRIKNEMDRTPNIDDIVDYVNTAADQANDPVFGRLLQCRDKSAHKDSKSRELKGKPRSNFNTGVDLPATKPAAHQPQEDARSTATGQPIPKAEGPCHYCNRGHSLFGCNDWKALRVQERLNFVQGKRLCVNCLRSGHRTAECRRNTVCTVPGCGQRHTKFLHLPTANGNPNSSQTSANRATQSTPSRQATHAPSQSSSNNATCSLTGAGMDKVALPIVPIKVRGEGNASFLTTYGLLDSGSTQSFCSEVLMRQLGVPGKHDTMRLTTLDKSDTHVDTFVVSLEVSDLEEENLVTLSNVLTRPMLHISRDTLVSSAELKSWPHLQDIVLPDVSTKEIHILIGQDNPSLLIPKEVRDGGAGAPYAARTLFGWTLNGPMGVGPSPHPASSHFIATDTSLQDQVEKFWKLDEMGDDHIGMSISDRKVISIWAQSVCRDGGHYSMDIPFKCRPPNLHDNKQMAKHRLRLLGKRLDKDKQLQDKYVAGIAELRNKKYAEVVPLEELQRSDGYTWYLPHHPVLHPRKPDKVCIVFDCAAKYHGTSLNDKIHQGPDLTNKLVGVLARFRQEPVAVMADIESMFHQVLVNRHDRDSLRFLWWEDDNPACDIQVYRMTAHLFGGVWSPSCANFALKRTAKDYADSYDKDTINTVNTNFYVDDCLKSVSTVEQAVELIRQLREMLSKGGFRLTKWISNSREVLHTVPENEWAKEVRIVNMDQELLPVERALGVLWRVEEDTLGFDVNINDTKTTRRGLLSTVSSVYDPLGFVSPFILLAKMLFQQLCRLKIGWDEAMPPAIAIQWDRWVKDLPLLRDMSIPRCIKPTFAKGFITMQLHHFSDASEGGFGAVSYLRTASPDGQVYCCLVMSKAKLAPLKISTIPRLELAAAVVSIKLDQLIRLEMDGTFMDSVYWSDSMIVLNYVRNEDKRFQTFVANRVAKIRGYSSPSQWRYIDTKTNPTDDVSRGLTAKQLVDHDHWVKGPNFLWQDSSAWPVQPDSLGTLEDDDPELKRDITVYTTKSGTSAEDVMDTISKHYSSWHKFKKAVAWLLRFKSFLRRGQQDKRATGPLTVVELRAAEREIVLHLQQGTLGDTLLMSTSVRRLSPRKSPDNIISVGGRLGNASINDDAKHPWILPNRHPIVDMLIRHYHSFAGHSGTERILAEIRQRFWIIKGRAAVKRVIHRCIPCRRRKAPTESQCMADLPEDRVTHGLAPFTKVGVDLFGPFIVKRARSEVKRYGCLFTCLTTRAIHIEVCHSLETDSFINALHRFISRRGHPMEVRSDNGTNFIGGEKELRLAILHWNQTQIQGFLLQREIQWIFNPPAASHMGGVWERQIRTVRAVLSGLLHQQTLDDETLVTLMCIVEGIINGRPITKVSDDPQDDTPLTPNHLLLLRSGPALPPGVFVEQDIHRRRWRQVQYLANIFWQRWLKEYLPTLQARQKWLCPKRNIQVGDLVLIKYENTPRYQWPLGLVVHVYPGKDGRVRSAQVRARGSIYHRPISRLCLLEGAEMLPTSGEDQ